MVIEVKYLFDLTLDSRDLESIKDSLEKAKEAVKTAWTPGYQTINDDIDKVLSEVNRVIKMSESKRGNVPNSHIVYQDEFPYIGFNCSCPKEKDHHFRDMTEAEVAEHVNTDLVAKFTPPQWGPKDDQYEF